MTGQEHYREAERLAAQAETWADADTGWRVTLSAEERIQRRAADLAAAQVHATLAVAAATALEPSGAIDTEDPDYLAWVSVASVAAPIREVTS